MSQPAPTTELSADVPAARPSRLGRRALLGFLAGCAWGAIGVVLAGQALGTAVWAGVAAAPLIGVAVALLFRGFPNADRIRRIGLALLSLYLGAGLFALAAGIADALRPIPHRDALAVVIQSVLGVWWGITFTGYIVVLWPLTYLTHWLLARAESSNRAG